MPTFKVNQSVQIPSLSSYSTSIGIIRDYDEHSKTYMIEFADGNNLPFANNRMFFYEFEIQQLT